MAKGTDKRLTLSELSRKSNRFATISSRFGYSNSTKPNAGLKSSLRALQNTMILKTKFGQRTPGRGTFTAVDAYKTTREKEDWCCLFSEAFPLPAKPAPKPLPGGGVSYDLDSAEQQTYLQSKTNLQGVLIFKNGQKIVNTPIQIAHEWYINADGIPYQVFYIQNTKKFLVEALLTRGQNTSSIHVPAHLGPGSQTIRKQLALTAPDRNFDQNFFTLTFPQSKTVQPQFKIETSIVAPYNNNVNKETLRSCIWSICQQVDQFITQQAPNNPSLVNQLKPFSAEIQKILQQPTVKKQKSLLLKLIPLKDNEALHLGANPFLKVLNKDYEAELSNSTNKLPNGVNGLDSKSENPLNFSKETVHEIFLGDLNEVESLLQKAIWNAYLEASPKDLENMSQLALIVEVSKCTHIAGRLYYADTYVIDVAETAGIYEDQRIQTNSVFVNLCKRCWPKYVVHTFFSDVSFAFLNDSLNSITTDIKELQATSFHTQVLKPYSSLSPLEKYTKIADQIEETSTSVKYPSLREYNTKVETISYKLNNFKGCREALHKAERGQAFVMGSLLAKNDVEIIPFVSNVAKLQFSPENSKQILNALIGGLDTQASTYNGKKTYYEGVFNTRHQQVINQHLQLKNEILFPLVNEENWFSSLYLVKREWSKFQTFKASHDYKNMPVLTKLKLKRYESVLKATIQKLEKIATTIETELYVGAFELTSSTPKKLISIANTPIQIQPDAQVEIQNTHDQLDNFTSKFENTYKTFDQPYKVNNINYPSLRIQLVTQTESVTFKQQRNAFYDDLQTNADWTQLYNDQKTYALDLLSLNVEKKGNKPQLFAKSLLPLMLFATFIKQIFVSST